MAGNSKDSKILAYKDMINQLNKTISAQTELIQDVYKRQGKRKSEIQQLYEELESCGERLMGYKAVSYTHLNGYEDSI